MLMVLTSLVELDLTKALEIAKRNSMDVISKLKELEIAKYERSSTRANLFPSLSMNGMLQYNFNPAEIVLGFPTRYIGFPNPQTPDPNDLIIFPDTTSFIYDTIPFRPRIAMNLQITLRYMLFDWFRTSNSLALAGRRMDVLRKEVEFAKKLVEFEVASLYMDVLAMKSIRKFLLKQYENSRSILASIERRYENGLASRIEYLQAKVSMENARYNYERANDTYESLKFALASLIGIEDSIVIRDSLEGLALDTSYTSDIQGRLDIELLEENIQSLELTRKIVGSMNKPNIVAQVDFIASRPSPTLKEDFGTTLTASLLLIWNFFDGWKTSSEVGKVEKQMELLELKLKFAKLVARNELRSAIKRLESARRSLEESRRNLELARELFMSISEQYRNGIVDYVRYAEAERMFVSARMNSIDALRNYYKALLEVRRISSVGGSTR